MTRSVRSSVRRLLATPYFFGTSVLSIAIAIGLAGSVISVVQAAFFTPLPYANPDRLVEFWQTPYPGSLQAQDYLQPVRMREWTSAPDTRHLTGISGAGLGSQLLLTSSEIPRPVSSAPILGDWFGTLGVEAATGRVLTQEDLRPGAERAAVVSEAFARRELPGGVGSVIGLGELSFTVVGVMPHDFDPEIRVWIPTDGLADADRPVAYAGVARLRDGSTVEQAREEVHLMSGAQVQADSGRYGGLGATAGLLGAQARTPNKPALWLLAGIVLAVVLLGASNLTQVYLVYAQGRGPKLAVRAALGGSPWQIGRALAGDAAVIGVLGTGLGLGLALVGKDVARALLGPEYVALIEPTVGAPVVGVAVLIGVLVSLMMALEPLRRMATLDIQALLRRRAAASLASPGERRTRNVLVSSQIAICVVLVAGTGIVYTAYRALSAVEMGFDTRSVVQAAPDYRMTDLSRADQWELGEALAERLESRVEIASATAWHMIGEDYPPRPETGVVTDGLQREYSGFERLHRFYEVRPGFFATLGIEVVEGRAFTASDDAGGSPVAVVTQRAADLWWPQEPPLGRQVRLGASGPWMTVVGVVSDVQDLDAQGRSVAARGPMPPLLFAPAAQTRQLPTGWRVYPIRGGVMVGGRSAGSTAEAVRVVRSELEALAPELPIESVTTLHAAQMSGYAGRTIQQSGRLVLAGAAIAVFLALLGIAGVVLESVSRRTREIGVRVALGARSGDIVRLVAGEGLMVSIIGVTSGILVAGLADQILSGRVFGYFVTSLSAGVFDPTVLLGATGAISAVTVLCAVSVAMRSTRIAPVDALRSE